MGSRARPRRDTRRDAYLKNMGYPVARFPNGMVLDAPETVREQSAELGLVIYRMRLRMRRDLRGGADMRLTPSPTALRYPPLPQGGEGRRILGVGAVPQR